MKIGRFEVRRANAATTPVPQGEYGADGDNWLARWSGGGPDVNPNLTGRRKFEVYDEMALSDAVVRALLWMLELPIVGAVWDFEPASDSPDDQLVAEACRWQFGIGDYDGQLDQSWQRTLRQKLLKNRYGCMFEEIVWGDPIQYEPADGGPGRLVRPISRLAPRLPKTIDEAKFQAGQVQMIRQHLPDASPIPGEKVCYYVQEPRPGRWDGTAIIRPAWGPWELKRELMISAGIAWDRWAAGFPEVRYPASGGNVEEEKAIAIGREIRNHERGYVAFAGPAPTDQRPDGWSIDIKGGGGILPDPVPLLKQYDLLILWAGLQTWLGLAVSSSTGARATASVQDEPYYMAIEAQASDLAREVERQPVRKFVDVNFGEQVKTPSLTVSKIQSEDVSQLASTLANLKLAGFDFSQVDLQNDVRERLHLPDLPEDEELQPTEGDGLPSAPPEPPAPPAAQ